MLKSVVKTSHMPGSRELFYSSVSKQLLHHLVGKKAGEHERDILANAAGLAAEGQLLEYLKNADAKELDAISQKVVEILTSGYKKVTEARGIKILAADIEKAGIYNLISKLEAAAGTAAGASVDKLTFLQKEQLKNILFLLCCFYHRFKHCNSLAGL